MINAVIKAASVCCLAILPTTFLMAQEEADFMRSLGKLYVVVAVIVAIFIGIVIFLVYLDRKLTKLENQIHHQNG